MMKLREKYTKEIAPMLKEKLGFKSIMQGPKLEKITINMGVGEASKDKGVLEHAVQDLEAIAGQKVVITRARKAVSTFKIREEYPIGCKVTLRGEKMYDFFQLGKMQKKMSLRDLVKSLSCFLFNADSPFLQKFVLLHHKIGLDTDENEPLRVYQYLVRRSATR